MNPILEQIKQILITAILMLCIVSTFAQKRQPHVAEKQIRISNQLKEVYQLTAQADCTFIFPNEFKEVRAPDDEDFSFDYAMELPGKDFEIWFQVKSEKE